MIYAIEAVGAGRVKIGFSEERHTLVWRLKAIETHCPFDVRVVGVLPSGKRGGEKGVHKKWERLRVKGEWFLFTDELADFVEKYFTPFEFTQKDNDLALLMRSENRFGSRMNEGVRTRARTKGQGFLLEDERFVSLEQVSERDLSYQPGQEAWLLAKEEATGVTTAARKAKTQGRHGADDWPDIFRLRNEGLTFAAIGERLNKSGSAVYAAWRRAQGRLNKKRAV